MQFARQLDITYRPRKLFQNRSYNVRDIDQIYIKKSRDLGIWKIMMIVDEGKGQKHKKLTSVRTVSKAKFLEQEIEQYLGIQDVEVPEED